MTVHLWEGLGGDLIQLDQPTVDVSVDQPQPQPQQVEENSQREYRPHIELTSIALPDNYTLASFTQNNLQLHPAYISLNQHILAVKDDHRTTPIADNLDVDVQLTPVTLRPRKTHPGCSTIKYNRPSNPDLVKRRIHFCNFVG